MIKVLRALLYCTKQPHKLYATNDGYVLSDFELGEHYKTKEKLNGKIVAECDFEVEWCDTSWCCGDFIEHKGLEKSCLTKEQLFDYVKGRNEFYAIHIKNLHIFDKPKELECYDKINKKDCFEVLHNAPQNMMKVVGRDDVHNEYILISIQPQWMCLILNHIKDVEVRRVVLKEMLKNE